jgi:hypothetical protein
LRGIRLGGCAVESGTGSFYAGPLNPPSFGGKSKAAYSILPSLECRGIYYTKVRASISKLPGFARKALWTVVIFFGSSLHGHGRLKKNKYK